MSARDEPRPSGRLAERDTIAVVPRDPDPSAPGDRVPSAGGPGGQRSGGTSEDRLERERAFHDHRFADGEGDVRRADRFYVVNGESAASYRAAVLAGGEQGRVLEIGCGPDSLAFELADGGAEVLGIDLSPVAIEAVRGEVPDHAAITFEVMDAEHLDVEDDSVDLVIGSGILHHLDIDQAMLQVRRVLHADGRAVFLEPLGHNPLINLYRRVTPSERTPDEHPLLNADLDALRRQFGSVETSYFVLLALLALPFRRFGFFDRLVGALQAADRKLFRVVPALRALAWTIVIELRRPIPVEASPHR